IAGKEVVFDSWAGQRDRRRRRVQREGERHGIGDVAGHVGGPELERVRAVVRAGDGEQGRYAEGAVGADRQVHKAAVVDPDLQGGDAGEIVEDLAGDGDVAGGDLARWFSHRDARRLRV